MVGVPLTDSDGSVSAIMFIAAQSKELNSYILEIFRIFLLSSIMVLIFTFVAVYSFSKRMTRPLILCEYAHAMGNSLGTVSYTHLTLPTICSV